MAPPAGVAGVRGAGVRSDCWVEVRPTTDGAPRVEVSSRVEAMYGPSIRALVRSTLETLDATDLSVTLQDSGALPFTLVARLEAAVRRLRPAGGRDALPAEHPDARYPLPPDRPRRSRLYLPGNTPRLFVNAGLHAPDAVVLDLEDSVPPEEKDAARLLVRAALRAVSFYGAEKMVRINPLPTGLEDVRALAPQGVHTFLLAKTERAAEVQEVHALVQALRRDGLVGGRIGLIPILESARGVLEAPAIAGAPGVVALAIGMEDYLTDVGAQRTAGGREGLWAMSQVVNAARAAGVQPLGSVYSDVDDADGLRAWAQEARALGFDGVACIHPRQVRVVHEAFAPSEGEVQRAARIVAAYEAARAAGQGVVAVDGAMVDAPVAARAARTLRLAQVAGPPPARQSSGGSPR